MKNTKRWIALLLAIVLVAGNAAYSKGTALNAETPEAYSEEAAEPAAESLEEVTEEAPPEEVIAEEPEITKEEVVVEEKAEEPETPVTEPTAETPAAPVTEPTAETPAVPVTEEPAVPAVPAVEPVAELAEVPEELLEEVPELTYPEIRESFDVNGMTVVIHAPEGAFPEGTSVEVEELSKEESLALAEKTTDEEKVVADARFVDITFYFEGEEIQPEDGYEVSVKFENMGISGDEYSICHAENAETVDKVKDISTGDSASFHAESFSPYGGVGYAWPSNTQTAYYYILKPGMTYDQVTDLDASWYNAGTGEIYESKSADRYSLSTIATGAAAVEAKIKTEPAQYPNIQSEGTTYTYDEDGGVGTYRIEWYNLVVANGANTGINQGPVVASGTNTFHVNGIAVLNSATECTVLFKTKEPGSSSFAALENGAFSYAKGTAYSAITVPAVDATKTDANGATYTFDGWYTDETCTQKVDFTTGTLSDYTEFFGRYVRDYSVKYYASDSAEFTDIIDPNGYADGEEFTVLSCEGTHDNSQNHVFLGWTTDKDLVRNAQNVISTVAVYDRVMASGKLIEPGKKLNINGADVKLYAVWASQSVLATYNITYVLDGGTNAAANPATYTMRTADITLQDPVKKGFVFEGWYREGTFTNQVTGVAIPTGSEGDKTFYAKWRELESQGYEDDFIKGGDNNPDDENETKQGQINVEVYVDSTTATTRTGVVKYIYEDTATVDFKFDLKSDKHDGYVINKVTAQQSSPVSSKNYVGETACLLDNVADGTTVRIYITSLYSAKYYIDGVKQTAGAFYDSNKYTQELTLSATAGETLYSCTDQPTQFTVASLAGTTHEGWTIKADADTYKNGGQGFVVKDHLELAEDNAFNFYCESRYKLTITYKYHEGEEGNAAELPPTYTETGLKSGDTYSVASGKISGYVADTKVVAGAITDSDAAYEVVYHKDSNGDDIPDCAQYHFTVAYSYHAGEEGTEQLPADIDTYLKAGAPYDAEVPTITNYVAVVTVNGAAASSINGTSSTAAVAATVVYHKDDNGNKIPDCTEDRYTIDFTTEGNGSLTGRTSFEDILTGSLFGNKVTVPTPVPEDGYKFDGWTPAIPDNASAITKSQTYTAKFSVRTDLSYEVHYFFDGTEDGTMRDTSTSATFGTAIPYSAETPLEHAGKNYVLDRVVTSGDKTVSTTEENNIINVYYDVDEIGEKDPEKPDDIADKYQVVFTYVAGSNGSVSGTIKEVATKYDASNKQSETGTAHPKAEVTAEAADGYQFVNWTAGNAAFENTAAIKAAGFTEDTEFTANFTRDVTGVSITGITHEYDGNSYSITVDGRVTGDTVEYSTDGGATWIEENPSYSEVKLVNEAVEGYPVDVRITNGGSVVWNSAELDKTALVTITQREATITVESTAKYYGADDPDFKGTVGNLVKDTDLGTVTYQRAEADKDKENVGDEIAIVAVYTPNDNYRITATNGKLSIIADTALQLDVIGTDETYNGTAYGLTKVTPSVTAGTTILYSEDEQNWREEPFNYSEAGAHLVYVKAENNNYNPSAVMTGIVNIKPAEVTITVQNDSKIYGKADPDFKGSVVGLVKDTDLGTISYTRNGVGVDEDVNTYKGVLTATYTVDNSNYDVKVIPADFEIKKSDENSVDASDVKTTYDGKEHSTGTVTPGKQGSKVEYSEDNENWQEAPFIYTEAGTYPVHIRVTNPNYEDVNTTVNVIIEQRVATIIVDSKDKYFGEADPPLTGTVGNLVKDTDLGTVTYRRHSEDISYENVGDTIRLVADYTANKNYIVNATNGKLEIKKGKNLTVTPVGTKETYDGTAYGLTSVTASDTEGTTILYSEDGVNFDTKALVYTEAGTHTVYVKAQNPNYEDSVVVPADVLIEKAKATITVTADLKIYGEADPDFKGTVKGLVKDNDLGIITYERTNEGVEDVNNYPGVLTAIYAPNQNYDVTVNNADFKIIKSGANGLSVTDTNETYDGTEYGPGESRAAVAGSEITYSVDGTNWTKTPKTYTNAGSYPIKVKATHDNYEDVITTVYVNIAKRAANIVVNSDTKPYGTADPAFTGTVSNLVNKDDLGTVTYRRHSADESKENAGDIIRLVADYTANDNYTVNFTNGTLEITKVTDLTVAVEGTEKTYDGKSYGLTKVTVSSESTKNKGLEEGTKILYSTDNVNFTEKVPTFSNAGSYTVYVKAQNPNYEDSKAASGTIVINRAKAAITVNNATKVYNAAEPTFTGTITGLVNANDLGSVSYKRTNAEEAVGVYAGVIGAVFTANNNYDVTVENGNFEIVRATDNGVAVTDTNVVYDGEEHGPGTVTPTQPGSNVEYSEDGENWSPVPPTFTEAGAHEVIVRVTNPGYEDVTATTTVNIAARPLTITAASATKTYDGAPLTSTSAAITDGSLASGHNVSFVNVVGSQTEVGTGANVASNATILSGERNVTANYAITYLNGALTVNAAGTTGTTTTPTGTPTTTTPAATPLAPIVAAVQQAAAVVTGNDGTAGGAAAAEQPVVVDGDNGNYDLTEVADEEVPLANQDLGNHKCCILHFLILLLALIIEIIYTNNMKKRQARIFELREQLELEGHGTEEA